MNELFQLLAQNTSLTKEKPLSPREVIDVQKELTRLGFSIIPEDFLLLLKQYNGIKGEDGAVLGISPKNKILDILAFNKAHNAAAQKIILGYDDFSFFSFDNKFSRSSSCELFNLPSNILEYNIRISQKILLILTMFIKL